MSSTQLLSDYYATIARPLLEGLLSYRRLAVYDTAIATFDRFNGCGVPIAQVSEPKLSRYVLQSTSIGSRTYRQRLALCIRRVVRMCDPAALEAPRAYTEPRQPPREASLRAYTENSYLVQLVGCSPQYKQDTLKIISTLSDFLGRDVLLAELSDRLASEFFTWLLDQGLAAVTVNNYRGTLFAIWRHAHRNGLVGVEPKVPKLRIERREPDAWTIEQFCDILAAALRFRPDLDYHGIPRNYWWHAALLTAYWTALRRSALFKIRQADVDLKTGWVSVPASSQKNKCGKRYRLGADALQAIGRIWQPKRTLLFPRLDHTMMNKHFVRILADAGIPDSDRPGLNKWHAVRRTVATQAFLARGVGVASALLGHSEEQITLRYIDPRFTKGNDATEFLPELPQASGM